MIGTLFGLSGGLGAVTQSPLARVAVRYWWVTVPLGYLAWKSYQRRKAAGKVDMAEMVNDLAPAATLVMSLIMLDLTLRGQAQQVSGLAGQPQPPPAPRTVDVEAEVVPPAAEPLTPPSQGAHHAFV